MNRDLRDLLVMSIDPAGCEDVDDALSVRQLEGGLLELGVHIADVTHFVPPGSLTDQEARRRATTVLACSTQLLYSTCRSILPTAATTCCPLSCPLRNPTETSSSLHSYFCNHY